MITVVNDQHRPLGETGCQLGFESVPSRRGLYESGVVLSILSVREAGGGKGTLTFELGNVPVAVEIWRQASIASGH